MLDSYFSESILQRAQSAIDSAQTAYSRAKSDFDSAEEFLSSVHANVDILALVRERQELLRDAWLTAIGHQRPGLPRGLPLDEAKARAAAVELRLLELLPR